MYTHARQFPHLAGISVPEIRDLVRRGMSRRPHLVRIMRIRNAVVIGGMLLAVRFLTEKTHLELGLAMMLAGGVATAALIVWNLVWLNTVLFRITSEEAAQP